MNDDFKKRFDYLMSLSNKNLRKEIENSNWVFILQELRYAGETIETYENMRKETKKYIEEHIVYETDDCINGMQFCSYHLYDFSKEDLLNILNKVGDSDE